ncbi:MAG TPA: hypothetical protein VFA81_13430 [Burkholderiales bacterium]|nr:hypothetical protein [Burkholderiales bacterium]
MKQQNLVLPAGLLALFALAPVGWAAGFGNDSIACPSDAPCIVDIYETTDNGVGIDYRAHDRYDAYNIRWSRPGKPEVQVEHGGGYHGSFVVRNAHRLTRYTFKVQGCNRRFLGSSSCSAWEVRSIKTGAS